MKMSKKILNIPSPPNCPTITLEQLQSEQPFYKGQYCDVFSIKKNNKQYAVKAIYLNRITYDYDEQFNRICSEIKILYSIDHVGVIKLLGHFQRDDVIGLIFPMFGRPISQVIRQRKKKANNNKLFTVNDFIKIFRSIGTALAELHALGYIHRDISEDNVLIDENYETKLIDFGCVANIDYSKGYFGTREFLAPEILEKRNYNHKVDVWSFGILCYQLLFGIYLFKPKTKNLSDEELDQHYLINMKQPIEDPSDEKLLTDQKPQLQVLTMIKSMLNYNPDKRPEIGYLLSKKIFGAEQRQALTYNIEQYVRQKTSRKSNKAHISLHSNVKQMEIKELQQTLLNLLRLNTLEYNKRKEILANLANEELKLVQFKYGKRKTWDMNE